MSRDRANLEVERDETEAQISAQTTGVSERSASLASSLAELDDDIAKLEAMLAEKQVARRALCAELEKSAGAVAEVQGGGRVVVCACKRKKRTGEEFRIIILLQPSVLLLWACALASLFSV